MVVVVFEIWLVFLSKRLSTRSPEKDSSPSPTSIDFDETSVEGQNLAINTLFFLVLSHFSISIVVIKTAIEIPTTNAAGLRMGNKDEALYSRCRSVASPPNNRKSLERY